MSISEVNTNRRRNKNNLLHIAYNPKFPNLKVLKKCRSHLAVMGVPGSNGDHFLWPEEVVYLMENCLAVVTKQDKFPMTIQEGYCMLEQKKVPFYKYLAYCTLKRTGFVVIRPRKRHIERVLPQCTEEATTSKACDEKRSTLLECFPSVEIGLLHMPQLHRLESLVPVKCEIKIHSSTFRISRNSRRQKPCRPLYWPSLEYATLSSSWVEYSDRKRNLLDTSSMSSKKRKAEVVATDMTHKLAADFEVYLPQHYSYNVDTTPVFSVICLDPSTPILLSNMISHLSGQHVVYSIFDNGRIAFINASGSSIDITHLL